MRVKVIYVTLHFRAQNSFIASLNNIHIARVILHCSPCKCSSELMQKCSATIMETKSASEIDEVEGYLAREGAGRSCPERCLPSTCLHPAVAAQVRGPSGAEVPRAAARAAGSLLAGPAAVTLVKTVWAAPCRCEEARGAVGRTRSAEAHVRCPAAAPQAPAAG